MDNNINRCTESIKSLFETDGFKDFMQNISHYKIADKVTIPNVIGDLKWKDLDRNTKVSIGKLIKNNITLGNLVGLQPLSTPNGSAQKYQLICDVTLKNIFWINYGGQLNNINNITMDPNTAFVFVSYDSKRTNNDVTLKCVIYVGNKKILESQRTKKLGSIGTSIIPNANQEFPAIQSIWYGEDRIFENIENIIGEGARRLILISGNPQMVLRIAGEKFDAVANDYDYTEYIQNNFRQFNIGELREIKLPQVIYSCTKKEI
ncbi:hypothetical protein, partial [Clostridium botulinum]